VNLLEFPEIFRVLLIGIFSGTTIICGFALSYFAHVRHINFLQDLIIRLEDFLEYLSGRTDTDCDRDVT